MSSIDYTPAPTVGAFIKHYTPGELFADWIIGPVGCTSGDTEFLTPSGWKRIDAYRKGDQVAQWNSVTGSMQYVQPIDYIKAPVDTLHYFHNDNAVSMQLSGGHRMPLYDYQGRFCIRTAADIAKTPSRYTVPVHFNVDGGLGLTSVQIQLRVMIAADGHYPKVGNQCIVAVRRERKKQRVREVLRANKIDWTERNYANRPTELIFTFQRPEFAKPLHESANWYQADSSELRVLLAEVSHWDGLYDHSELRFSTVKRAEADVVQFAAHATGNTAHIRVDEYEGRDWNACYVVQWTIAGSAKARVALRGDNLSIDTVVPSDGLQYCFTVSSTFWIARHNGRIFVTGNSGKTTGNFFKLIYMASKQAKSPVDGIRRVKAVVVRNTGPQLRDTTIPSWMIWFKDGQAGKWHATDARFTLKFADIECEVLFRALDSPDDVARVLSLEVTFAILDEFVQIPKEVVDALAARCGRYPSINDGRATNWGMWGASNPGNEDDWWYEALNNAELVTSDQQEMAQRRNERILMGLEPSTWTYFKQPSGFSLQAENLDKLPGGTAYYTSLAKDHTPSWIKQFIEVEWGYSLAGTPVIATFNPKLHIADQRLIPNKFLPLIGGFDPGMNSAMILGQQNNHGRLNVLDELVQRDMGAERFVSNRLRPLLRSKYPDFDFTISPDPAAAQRAQTNEKTVVDVLKRHFKVRMATTNNRLPGRIEAIEHFTCRLTEDGPALQIDPTLKHLIRGLRGGWQYSKSNRGITSPEPVKNDHSHPCDGFGYLCQHFYRDHSREVRSRDMTPQRVYHNNYHVR